jgi:hypothetical protein
LFCFVIKPDDLTFSRYDSGALFFKFSIFYLSTVIARTPSGASPIFVTIGSPLGAEKIVFGHLEPAPVDGVGAWPGSVVSWTNVAAIGDHMCAAPKLAERFGPRVADFAVDNGHRAHDPEPYLNAAVTGHAVAAGLVRPALPDGSDR